MKFMEGQNADIIKKYFKNSLNFIIFDLILDFSLYFLSISLVSSNLIKTILYIILISSSIFLISILYYDYISFKKKFNIIRKSCKGEIFYNKKKNVLICRNNNLRICASLDYNRVYLNIIENYIKKAEDTNDFYCTRFEDGRIEKKEGLKVFQGKFRLIDNNEIILCSGKSIIINKIDKIEIENALNMLLSI